MIQLSLSQSHLQWFTGTKSHLRCCGHLAGIAAVTSQACCHAHQLKQVFQVTWGIQNNARGSVQAPSTAGRRACSQGSTNCIQLPKQRLLVIFEVLKNLIPQIHSSNSTPAVHGHSMLYLPGWWSCFRYMQNISNCPLITQALKLHLPLPVLGVALPRPCLWIGVLDRELTNLPVLESDAPEYPSSSTCRSPSHPSLHGKTDSILVLKASISAAEVSH